MSRTAIAICTSAALLAPLPSVRAALSPLVETPAIAATVDGSSRALNDSVAAVVPPGIPRDCSVDVTERLNEWFASVADGATLTFGSGACYRVDGTLELTDRHDLTLVGNGALFAAYVTPPPTPKITRQMWHILGGTGLTMRDMTVQGTNPTATFDVRREWFPLIQLDGAQKVLIEDVHGSNSWGDFLSLTPDTRGTVDTYPREVKLRNSSSDVIGRTAVMCNGCEDIVIRDNTFTNTGYQVFNIEVEAPYWHARDVAFTGNTIGGKIPLSVLVNAGIGHDVTDITFARNTMTSTPISCESPIYILDTEPIKTGFDIRDNHLRTLGAAARIAGVSRVLVLDNVVEFVDGGMCRKAGAALRLADSDGAVIGNDFQGFSWVASVEGRVTGLMCGNRLAGEAFDEPIPCPCGHASEQSRRRQAASVLESERRPPHRSLLVRRRTRPRLPGAVRRVASPM